MASPDGLLVWHCMTAGVGIARVPDGRLPVMDGSSEPIVPVLSDVIGREIQIRVVMPDTHRMRPLYRRLLAAMRTAIPEV